MAVPTRVESVFLMIEAWLLRAKGVVYGRPGGFNHEYIEPRKEIRLKGRTALLVGWRRRISFDKWTRSNGCSI
jgi:hypothetical protein